MEGGGWTFADDDGCNNESASLHSLASSFVTSWPRLYCISSDLIIMSFNSYVQDEYPHGVSCTLTHLITRKLGSGVQFEESEIQSRSLIKWCTARGCKAIHRRENYTQRGWRERERKYKYLKTGQQEVLVNEEMQQIWELYKQMYPAHFIPKKKKR